MTDNPFQTMREVDDYLSGDVIVCLICGESFQRLTAKHLRLVHNLSADDYRSQFGIPLGRSLTSAPSRAKSGAAMTPERIRQLISVSQVWDPNFPRGTSRIRVRAVANQWKKTVERGRYFSRKLVIVSCSKCGCDVATTALGATQPIRCMKCTSPASRKFREQYWSRKWRLD